MYNKTTPCLLLISLLLSSGCQSVSPALQAVPVECPQVTPPPAWMMEPEPEQTYTQQLRQTLSE